MSSDGWISIHRQICENEFLWGDKPFARGQAWIDLLMLMNHTDATKFVGGREAVIKRGQQAVTIRQLADRWGWSRTKISDFLNSLQSAGMAKIESDKKKTVITIANYSVYQDVKDKKETKKRQRGDTEKTPYIFNNNDNNGNNINIVIPPPLEMVKTYCEARGNGINPEAFIDHYDAVGWMVGKNKMKDWQAAVRTWEKRNGFVYNGNQTKEKKNGGYNY